jgi:hypothetical protein
MIDFNLLLKKRRQTVDKIRDLILIQNGANVSSHLEADAKCFEGKQTSTLTTFEPILSTFLWVFVACQCPSTTTKSKRERERRRRARKKRLSTWRTCFCASYFVGFKPLFFASNSSQTSNFSHFSAILLPFLLHFCLLVRLAFEKRNALPVSVALLSPSSHQSRSLSLHKSARLTGGDFVTIQTLLVILNDEFASLFRFLRIWLATFFVSFAL